VTASSVQAITAVPLFGASAFASKSQAMSVAPSHLSIQLLGTVVAGKASAAVLALHAGAEQKVVLLGQAIEPGVILKAVESEAIVVDNHGRMERIAMAKPALGPPPTLPSSL
jgi:type II secretory pathway component PulC